MNRIIQQYIERQQREQAIPYPLVDGLGMPHCFACSESQAAEVLGDVILRQAMNHTIRVMDSN